MSIAHSITDTVRTDDVLITESVDFSGLLLSDHVLRGLTDAGFKRPSPIQLKAIPLGRCGLDLIVQAKSGTGKTCVFTVIALEGLELNSACLQVLVLAPTREIALQVQDVIQTIGKPMKGLKCHSFIGGLPLDVDKTVVRSCQIAVGTPGRVKQLIEIGAMKTNSVRMFIMDEADKLLEEGFQETINWIYATLPQNKQILALSATYPEQLAQHLTSYMRNPTFVRLNTTDPALLGIKQYHFVVANHPMPNVVFSSKIDAVVKILSSVSFQQCLIFSNLQTRAQNLQSELLSRNWPTTCIAGFLDQKERNFAMEQLKTYKCRILISTDLTSRGIDADKVNLVINLDVPLDHETYLHRIGRAGRFGSFGATVTIVTKGPQETQLWAVEKKCRTYIHKLPVPIPNDLVTKPVPLRIDDIVSTEQIINQPTLDNLALTKAPASAASNHIQETVSSYDSHVVAQSSEQSRQSSAERMLAAEAESAGTERDTALTQEKQAELSEADLVGLSDSHVSDMESEVVKYSNCNSILEPGPLPLHETAEMSNDSNSAADSEFSDETLAENIGEFRNGIPSENGDNCKQEVNIGEFKHGIPAENGDNCKQEVNSDIDDNDGYEMLRENCNECQRETSTCLYCNCRHVTCPDNHLETVNVLDAEQKNSVNRNDKTPDVQISNGALNLYEDLATQYNSFGSEYEDLELKLAECLETSQHKSVSTVESINCLASLEIVNCEEEQLQQKSKVNNTLENNGPSKGEYHSNTDNKKICKSSLCDEEKPVLPTDTRDENKDTQQDTSEHDKDSDFISNSPKALEDVLHGNEPSQGVVSHGNIPTDVAASVSTSEDNQADSAYPSVDGSACDDGLVSDRALMVNSDISSTESNVNEASYSCDKLDKIEVASSMAIINVQACNRRDDLINDSEAPALAISDKCNYNEPSSGEIAQAESIAKAPPYHSQERLPVKYRKSVTKRGYLKSFGVSDFLQFVNESNNSFHSDETSYRFNEPDENCNGDTEANFPDDIATSVQDSMPCDLRGCGDFVSPSCFVPSGEHTECEMIPNNTVMIDNKESGWLPLDALGGGDYIDVVAGACVDSFSCPDGLLGKSGNISGVDSLDGNSKSLISVSGHGQHVEHMQQNNAENGMFDSTGTVANEARNSLSQTVCNSLPSASSEILHKSTNSLLIDCFSSLLSSSRNSSQLSKFADLEADHAQFCSDVNSTTISCSSELMTNLVPEDFEDSKDLQAFCALEFAKLALLKSTLKDKLVNAEEKIKSDLPIEARLKLRNSCDGDEQIQKTSQHSDDSSGKKVEEKSKQCVDKTVYKKQNPKQCEDETVYKKQKPKKWFKGKYKFGKGKQRSDNWNWRSAADENSGEQSAGEEQHFSPRKEIQKQHRPQNRTNSNSNDQLDQAAQKRDCFDVDSAVDLTSNQSQLPESHGDTLSERHVDTLSERHGETLSESHVDTLSERHGETLSESHSNTLSERHGIMGKHGETNKQDRQDDTNITGNRNRVGQESAKQKQVKPPDRKDDECKILDNMHAQMLLKRKLRKLERENLSGGDEQSRSCTTEATIAEDKNGELDGSKEQKLVHPSEHIDDGCKMLDNMHAQMLLKRKLKKLEQQLLNSVDVQSNSCSAEVPQLNKDEEATILKTVDKRTENLSASTDTKKTVREKSNLLLDIEDNVVLDVITNVNENCVCEENQKPNSNPEISAEDENQVAANIMPRKATLSGKHSKQKSAERSKLVKFKHESRSPVGRKKPTKPSKTEARLAGLAVSDGSTSSTSDLSLSSASDISDLNSSDVDTKEIILSSQCYANKYAQESYIDPRYGKSSKKEVTKQAPVHPAFYPQRDSSFQDSNDPSEVYLTSNISSVSLQDSHSTVFPAGNYNPYLMDYPITEHPLSVKSASKNDIVKHRLADGNSKLQHSHKSRSAGRKTSDLERTKTLAKDHKLSRKSRHCRKVVRHSDELRGSDSEDVSSDSSESVSHPYVTHHPNLNTHHMPWFPSYCNMQQSVYPASSYTHSMLPYYGPWTGPLSYPHRQQSAYSYSQFQLHTPSSQVMWYYVSHMTHMLSQLLRKHRREMERKTKEE
ncbi:hypothetical protein BsWGS_11408 [Bradybaena similaris]